jgi:transcriptional regulator with XRE-family HTH domain
MILSSSEIKAARIRDGLTQFQLAIKSGVSPGTIYRAEKGIPVSERALQKLTDALQRAGGAT